MVSYCARFLERINVDVHEQLTALAIKANKRYLAILDVHRALRYTFWTPKERAKTLFTTRNNRKVYFDLFGYKYAPFVTITPKSKVKMTFKFEPISSIMATSVPVYWLQKSNTITRQVS